MDAYCRPSGRRGDVEAMAFALADNQAVEESSWDEELLASNMTEISKVLESIDASVEATPPPLAWRT